MKLLDILNIYGAKLDPNEIKVHLAGFNGSEDPLDEYRGGQFDQWQSWQAKKNFERKYVLSLIDYNKANEWLFVGIYQSNGFNKAIDNNKISNFQYNLTKLPRFSSLEGRLIVKFKRSGRNSYRYAESIIDEMDVLELAREKLKIEEFRGYKFVKISRRELSAIVARQIESWKSALSSVAGVYLIRDAKRNDQLYVGSATGEGGIWQRWSQYAVGHGDVKAFRELHKEHVDRLNDLQFAILEIADPRTKKSEICEREMFWIELLGSRATGLNENGPSGRSILTPITGVPS